MTTSGDLETGKREGKVQPKMAENEHYRYELFRIANNIYIIQIFISVAAVIFLRHVTFIPFQSGAFLFLVFAFLLMYPMLVYRKNLTICLVLISVFTLAIAFAVNLASSFPEGKIVFAAGILTSMATTGLMIYTFWVAKKGHDFRVMLPLLFISFLIFIPFTYAQSFILAEEYGLSMYWCVPLIMLATLVIVTESVNEFYDYEDYIWATLKLIDDIVNYFA